MVSEKVTNNPGKRENERTESKKECVSRDEERGLSSSWKREEER